ncbi:LytTR family DNA-binding domain-containing protein [Prevotella sp. 10(H)]|uniref:LytR/AlgR family response regulator transcription factor n=1 Tax=Prevotella sp. 10(H) TaxID=1158294 RepID=UPI0004A7769E|nr:LytTR family DNA-binding domain-containing protein [Prevotella sp. 10(H)]
MKNRQLIYIHIFIALAAAVILFICFKPLINVPEYILITDSAVSGIALSGLLLLLRNAAKYVHFTSLPAKQQFINYGAMAILFVACWIGVEYLALYLSFPENEWIFLTSVIPSRIVIGLLVYSLTIVIFTRLNNTEEEIISDTANEVETPEDKSDTQELENIEILERIAVKNGQKIDVVLISEIIHLQAEGDYVMIHSTKGKYLKEQTMKSFESSLPTDKFVRVHRSSIVNVEFISQIELFDKQSQLLKLKNGNQVRISLSGYKTLKKTLGL